MLDLRLIIEETILEFKDERQSWKVRYSLKELLLLSL